MRASTKKARKGFFGGLFLIIYKMLRGLNIDGAVATLSCKHFLMKIRLTREHIDPNNPYAQHVRQLNAVHSLLVYIHIPDISTKL